MKIDAIVEAMCSEIKRNIEAFGAKEDLSELSEEGALRMSKALQEALAAGGQAGYREFILSYERNVSVVVKGNTKLRFKQLSDKTFLTPFGKVTIPRRLYQADAGGSAHVPLDCAWGMEGEFATAEVREAILYVSALVTPTEAETLFSKCALFHPSSTAVKHLVAEMGTALERDGEKIDAALRAEEAAPEGTVVMAASLDGVNVPLREPGANRGRHAGRPDKAQQLQESPTAFKNAMVASVSFYGPPEEPEKPPVRLHSRYMARMPEERFPTMKRQFQAEIEAAEAQSGQDVTKVLVLDGSKSLWNYVKEQPECAQYEKIIDFYHTCEHLAKAAEALFGKQSREGTRWFETYRNVLRERDRGGWDVLRSIDYYRRTLKLTAAQQRAALDQRTFFANNHDRMTYASFRRRGLPIGSGVVEAACKTLVKQRMCRSGMRWTRQGGQPILTMRAHIHSGRWDRFWQEHRRYKAAA